MLLEGLCAPKKKGEEKMNDYTYHPYQQSSEGNSYQGPRKLFDKSAIDVIEEGRLNRGQIAYMNKVFETMVQDGYFITKEDKQRLGKDVRDVSRWYPTEPSFRARVRHRLNLYKASNERHSASNAGEGPNGPECPAMQCMFNRCKEDRGRPWTHDVRWWERHTKDFDHIWPNIRQYLKSGYHSELWGLRSKFYGLHLCSAHMSQIMARFNKKCDKTEKLYKPYWTKQKKLFIKIIILFKIMVDNPSYFSIVTGMLN